MTEEQLQLFDIGGDRFDTESVCNNPQSFTVYVGDALERLKDIPSGTADCCVTSPPYYALRDYGTGSWEGGDPNCDHKEAIIPNRFDRKIDEKQKSNAGSNVRSYKKVCPKCGAVRIDYQIGMEETPEEYINALVEVFREVRRVIRDDGTLWLNISDSYMGSGSRGFDFTDSFTEKSKLQKGSKGTTNLSNVPKLHNVSGIKDKDMIGIPWMLAFALRNDGWYLRQDIIWSKPNPMPESVRDRCTKSHEYIFLFSKNKKYFFDQDSIKEDCVVTNADKIKFGGNKYGDNTDSHFQTYSGNEYMANGKRNKRDVWNVSVSSCSEAHFATYPLELCEPCIKAGSRMGGVVLDPFSGSGSTGIAATRIGRDYIGIELNREYVEITKRRARKECGCVVTVK